MSTGLPNGSDRLYAGAAQADITPDGPVHLSGDIGRYRPAKMVADPLYAKALVLRNGDRALCIVALDLTIITLEYTEMIRREVERRYGIPGDAVMVHAIQTHSAPALGRFMVDQDFTGIPPEHEWLAGGEERYSRFAVERAVDAVGKALDSMQPARIGAGSGIEGRYAYNRRAILRDGSVYMPNRGWEGGPTGPTHIRYIEGPIDPEVGVVLIQSDSLRPIAVLVNYACHPVHVFPKPIVSADWPGAVGASMQRDFGIDCPCMVLNGACGNINPWAPLDPDYVEDYPKMGRALASMASKVMQGMSFTESAVLDHRTEHIPLPFRRIDGGTLADVTDMLTKHPAPLWADAEQTRVEWDWMRAASIYSVYLQQKREGRLQYEIQTFRVGDTVLVGLPGEPFVECGLEVKLRSPWANTFVVHMVTQYIGYIPTPQALARGGHEANTTYWAKLAPEAFDLIVDAASNTLKEMTGN